MVRDDLDGLLGLLDHPCLKCPSGGSGSGVGVGVGGSSTNPASASSSLLQSRLLVQQLVRRVMIFVGLGKQSHVKGKGADHHHHDEGLSKDSGSEVR